MALTIKSLNKIIGEKYPHVILAKGNGYFYLTSNNVETSEKLCQLQSTSIWVPKISILNLTQWMDEVDEIMEQIETI